MTEQILSKNKPKGDQTPSTKINLKCDTTVRGADGNEIVNVSGDSCRTAFLIRGTKNVLYDTGMAYCAGTMIENIKRELHGEPLSAVLLSHSHYDHVAGLPYLRKEWPSLTAFGSRRAKEILEKSSARQTMRDLSVRAARGAGADGDLHYDENALTIDQVVEDSDILKIGSHKITVYLTPGHTRCSVSYLLDNDIMFASETVGVFTESVYMPCYLVGYRQALDAVEKLRRAPARRVFISHMGVLREKDTDKVWDYLASEIRKTKDEIVDIIKKHDTTKAQLQEMLFRYHDGVPERAQPDFAFLLNAEATLQVVKKECMEEFV